MRWKLLIPCLLMLACEPPRNSVPAHLVVELPSTQHAESLQLSPKALSENARLLGRRLLLSVDPARAPKSISVKAAGTCPLRIEAAGLSPGQTRYLELKPWIRLGDPRPELGFDQQFTIRAILGCSEAQAGTVVWRQVAGTPLEDLSTRDKGFVVTAKTPSFSELFGDAPAPGLVPVSPRSQGRVVLEAHYERGSDSVKSRVSLSAVSRSRGLPNVATDASVLLAGSDWVLSRTPDGASAKLSQGDGYSMLRPQTSGKWLLTNALGEQLSLYSAPYEEVPLDCTRSDCHSALDDHLPGRMSDVLSRGMNGAFGADYSLECASACHAVGEPGLDDGGFFDVARELDFDLAEPHPYSDLPPALKRLGNVGCLACHGPGAIPEAGARHGILSSDVCAYCHDAPPRYGHVEAWRETAMSRGNPALKSSAHSGCVDCHTTWGFLAFQKGSATARTPPVALNSGIDCVACHAVHQTAASENLLRNVRLPEVAQHLESNGMPSSRICLGCHAPQARDNDRWVDFPRASATALWLGRGGFADSGDPLIGPAVHATAPKGCLSCHQGSRGGHQRGGSHDFKATPDACKDCHDEPLRPMDTQTRARGLLKRLTALGEVPWTQLLAKQLRPAKHERFAPHANPGQLDISNRSGRAAYNLLLILEDPAAGVHNPDYAKLLLDHATTMLEHLSESPPRTD